SRTRAPFPPRASAAPTGSAPGISATCRSRLWPSPGSCFSSDSWSLQPPGKPTRRLPFRPMPSGKKARQQRQAAAAAAQRTPPPVRSKGVGGARGARQASPRTLAIGGGVVLVVVIAIVLAIVLGSSSGSGGSGGSVLKGLPATGSATWAGALDGAPDANNLFKGIPQKGLVLGSPSAPVEMEMFIDVQCPICQNFEVNYLPEIVQKYIRKGGVQLHLQPWAFLGGA